MKRLLIAIALFLMWGCKQAPPEPIRLLDNEPPIPRGTPVPVPTSPVVAEAEPTPNPNRMVRAAKIEVTETTTTITPLCSEAPIGGVPSCVEWCRNPVNQCRSVSAAEICAARGADAGERCVECLTYPMNEGCRKDTRYYQ